jgi:hypothetical protein
LSATEDLLCAYRKRLNIPWRPDETTAGRVWMLWYDKSYERRLRGRFGEFRLATEQAGKGWRELDLAPVFGEWIGAQKWFERAARHPSTLSTVMGQFEQHLVTLVRSELDQCGSNDVLALTGIASLFGFVRASKLISEVADFVPGRLLIAFPGTHQAGIYRLLDARDGWNYLAVPIPSSDVV